MLKFLALVLILPTLCLAEFGNAYETYDNGLGDTTTRGSNLDTGSTWESTASANGDQRGTDKNGDSWQYRESDGFYSKFGSGGGTVCSGKGANRVCF